MGQQDTQPSDGLILSSGAHEVAKLPPEVELVAMRQMMDTLFAKMDALQQNQAVHFSSVHNRLDAVELELPLIQEKNALRIRDLETRMSAEIEAAAQSAADGIHQTLAARIESQNQELAQLRESRKLTESRLDRAIQDIERLCATAAAPPVPEVPRPAVETVPSPYRSRIAEHIRKAAVEMAPDDSNPLLRSPDAPISPRPRPTEAPVPAQVTFAASKPGPRENAVPRFDDWKRQFIRDGEPLVPTLKLAARRKVDIVVCPRCNSERTRPATGTRLDGLLKLAGFSPYRCRACAYRFYKRGNASESHPEEDHAETPPEVLEVR
jgi:hypothetical protein